jgi:YbgC/YbaW family acyl-CoA thioester hydrolase
MTGPDPDVRPIAGSITVPRRVAWADTDASGRHHFTAVLRWVEEAENALLRQLDLGPVLSGRMPRAHVEVDYASALRFNDVVDVSVWIARVGASSITYEFRVSLDGLEAARGRYVTVLIDDDGRPKALPPGIPSG